MFNIVSSNEKLQVKNINILIYGEPSSGKTSLSNTSKKCLTLDFDKGSHRSAFRKDVLVIDNWNTIQKNLQDFIKVVSKYETIIIDTADSMLEFMGVYAISQNNRLATNKLQWYGTIKDMFLNFTSLLRTLNVDIIFTAHVKEKDEGDFRVKRPAIMGGSYDKVLQLCDFVGYTSFKENKRVLSFDPSEYHIGKNSAKIESVNIPDFNLEPEFMSNLINVMKNSLNNQNEKSLENKEIISTYLLKIQDAVNIEDLNLLVETLKNEPKHIKNVCWIELEKQGKILNATFNKITKLFEIVL